MHDLTTIDPSTWQRRCRRNRGAHQPTPALAAHLLACGATAGRLHSVRQLRNGSGAGRGEWVACPTWYNSCKPTQWHPVLSAALLPHSPQLRSHRLAGRPGQRLLAVLPHVPEAVGRSCAKAQAQQRAAERAVRPRRGVDAAVGSSRAAGAARGSALLAGQVRHRGCLLTHSETEGRPACLTPLAPEPWTEAKDPTVWRQPWAEEAVVNSRESAGPCVQPCCPAAAARPAARPLPGSALSCARLHAVTFCGMAAHRKARQMAANTAAPRRKADETCSKSNGSEGELRAYETWQGERGQASNRAEFS